MQQENGDPVYKKLYELLSESRNEELDEQSAPDHLRLEEDLGIYGDDASDFLIAFGEAFCVDLSKFDIGLYFSPEGGIYGLHFWKRKKQRLSPTISDLKEAIRSRVLL